MLVVAIPNTTTTQLSDSTARNRAARGHGSCQCPSEMVEYVGDSHRSPRQPRASATRNDRVEVCRRPVRWIDVRNGADRRRAATGQTVVSGQRCADLIGVLVFGPRSRRHLLSRSPP